MGDFSFDLKERVKTNAWQREEGISGVSEHRYWEGSLPQGLSAHPRYTEDASIGGWAKTERRTEEMKQIIRSIYSLNSLTPLILLTHSASLCFSSGSWLWLLYGHICRLWLQLHVWRRCHLQWVKLPTHGHCCKRGSNIRNSSHASGISLITLRTSLCGPIRHELEYEEFDSSHLWAVWAVTLCV